MICRCGSKPGSELLVAAMFLDEREFIGSECLVLVYVAKNI